MISLKLPRVRRLSVAISLRKISCNFDTHPSSSGLAFEYLYYRCGCGCGRGCGCDLCPSMFHDQLPTHRAPSRTVPIDSPTASVPHRPHPAPCECFNKRLLPPFSLPPHSPLTPSSSPLDPFRAEEQQWPSGKKGTRVPTFHRMPPLPPYTCAEPRAKSMNARLANNMRWC